MTMPIPGVVANRRTFVCNSAGRITIPVTYRGAGTYTLKLEHPISRPVNVVAYGGSSQPYTGGGQGQPYQNCFAWYVSNPNWAGAVFHVSVTAGMPGAGVEVTLYTARAGMSLPPAYRSRGSGGGHESSCVVM